MKIKPITDNVYMFEKPTYASRDLTTTARIRIEDYLQTHQVTIIQFAAAANVPDTVVQRILDGKRVALLYVNRVLDYLIAKGI